MDNGILLTNFELCEKLKAHKEGLQHFAFSVFLFNKQGELLLQKRAKQKYHSGGLWSNSCCSHFRDVNEFNNKETAIKKRIEEELGIFVATHVNDLHFVKEVEYNLHVGDLIENEHNFLYVGLFNGSISDIEFNKNEVENVKFITLNNLKKDIKNEPAKYTKWLEFILNDIVF